MSQLRSFMLVRPASGRLLDALDFYRERQIIEAAFPYGVLSGQILVPRNDPEDFMVTSVWGDMAGYKRWCAASERAEFLASVRPLLAAEDPISGWTGSGTGAPQEGYRPGTPLRVAHEAVAPSV